MKIPADCLFLEGFDVSTDEAAMTGESDNMDKTPLNEKTLNENPDCYLLAKTLLIQGQGTALVLAVGSNSRSGQAEEKLNIEEEATPLQLKLETIANEIGKLGVYVSILTFTAMTINLVIKRTLMTEEDGGLIHVKTLESLVDFIIIAITVIVVAVPEGLPLAVTISLAFSVMQMKKDNNLVRKL